MRFSFEWLREWVATDLDAQTVGDTITMAGLELDSLEPAAADFSGVVVGEVLSVEPHPDADKLNVCQVSNGNETVQVVCGAKNVAAGLYVPFAQVGARLPGDFKIKKAKLRGVESFGMLCAAQELGLAENSEGLMILPQELSVGADFREALQLNDFILDVDLTPNRADCLSVAGVAREVAALTSLALTPVKPNAPETVLDETKTVVVSDSVACPRYLGRVIRGVNVAAETPLWMQERLRRSGLRSLGPIVDVTNYVMLELGQPMHAFDLARLSGGMDVRMAKQGEKLTLLDGQSVELNDNTLVIADEQGALAMAGIMGGEASSVSDATRDIFLESAFFNPLSIAGRARSYGLHTDSSHRFERGVDPELTEQAIQRATALIVDVCGGDVAPITEVRSDANMPVRKAITLRFDRVERLLGIALEADAIVGILERLGCAVERQADSVSVTPPSYRFDLVIEADLIEEVARVHGYHNIPERSRVYAPAIRKQEEAGLSLRDMRHHLMACGYQEAITYSFVDPEMEKALAPGAQAVALANPISSELSVMRSTAWSGLLKAVMHNLNRQQHSVKLFEIGLNFIPQGDDFEQKSYISGVITGKLNADQWQSDERRVDFFDAKGDLESLLGLSELADDFEWDLINDPALHPGQSAKISLCGQPIARVGMLHPKIQQQLGIDQEVYLFEVQRSSLNKSKLPAYVPISKFPSIRRDLAILVDEQVTAQQIFDSLAAVEAEEIKDSLIFDVYTGEGVPKGRKSYALGLILQDLSRTLSEKEVEECVAKVMKRLGDDIGAILRS